MTHSAESRYDPRWRRGHVAVLTVMCAISGGLLAMRRVSRGPDLHEALSVDAVRAVAAVERIDPNTATIASLRRLPGIGPAKAAAIVAYREQSGRGVFRSPRDLEDVKGLGRGIVARIEPHLALLGE